MKKICFILTMVLLTACASNEQVINPDLDATVEAMVDAKLKDIVSSPTPEILIKGGTGSLSIDENNEVEIDVELIVETPTKTPSPKPPISPTPTIPAPTPTPTPEPIPTMILPTPTPIPFGEKVLPEGTFHFGSTYDEVIEAMGEPSFSFYEPGDEFNFYIYYRDDRANQNKVYFYNNKVIAWENFGLLKLANLQKRPDKNFDVGSTVHDVIEIMGNPDKIENFYTDCCLSKDRIWHYNYDDIASSRIIFQPLWTSSKDDGYSFNIDFDYEVMSWFNSGNRLSVVKPTPTPTPKIVSVPTPTETPKFIIVTPTPTPINSPTPTPFIWQTPTPTPPPQPINSPLGNSPKTKTNLNLSHIGPNVITGFGNELFILDTNTSGSLNGFTKINYSTQDIRCSTHDNYGTDISNGYSHIEPFSSSLTDIEFHSDDTVYVVDKGNNRILSFDSETCNIIDSYSEMPFVKDVPQDQLTDYEKSLGEIEFDRPFLIAARAKWNWIYVATKDNYIHYLPWQNTSTYGKFKVYDNHEIIDIAVGHGPKYPGHLFVVTRNNGNYYLSKVVDNEFSQFGTISADDGMNTMHDLGTKFKFLEIVPYGFNFSIWFYDGECLRVLNEFGAPKKFENVVTSIGTFDSSCNMKIDIQQDLEGIAEVGDTQIVTYSTQGAWYYRNTLR